MCILVVSSQSFRSTNWRSRAALASYFAFTIFDSIFRSSTLRPLDQKRCSDATWQVLAYFWPKSFRPKVLAQFSSNRPGPNFNPEINSIVFIMWTSRSERQYFISKLGLANPWQYVDLDGLLEDFQKRSPNQIKLVDPIGFWFNVQRCCESAILIQHQPRY